MDQQPDRNSDKAFPFQFRKLDVSAASVSEINAMLDWHAGTLLGGEIMVGRLGVTTGKRTKPGTIPDRRITKLHDLVGLTGKSILEVGCFEGIHTLGLRLYSDDVTAIDIRPSNVIKTLARLSLHGSFAKVFIGDVEKLSREFGWFDVVFHCGVLYHLASPVEHIFSLAGMCRYLLLDTHVASRHDVERTYDGFTYQGAYFNETGWTDPFSGKSAKSLWLTEESLLEALGRAGFGSIDLIERRDERNGPRMTILASR